MSEDFDGLPEDLKAAFAALTDRERFNVLKDSGAGDITLKYECLVENHLLGSLIINITGFASFDELRDKLIEFAKEVVPLAVAYYANDGRTPPEECPLTSRISVFV